MKNSLLWRALLILGVALAAVFAAYPPQEKINLGLDLRGGVHLVANVEVEDALRAESNNDMLTLRDELADNGVTTTGQVDDLNQFTLLGVTPDNEDQVRDAVDRLMPSWQWRREGGGLVFRRPDDEDAAIRDQAVLQAQTTIRNRVDAYGVAEPVILRQGIGGTRLVIQLPGVDDPERVKDLIGQTALLEFRLVEFGPAPSREAILANYGGNLPASVEMFEQDIRDPDTQQVIGQNFYALEANQVITGRDLRDARSTLGQFNEPVVGFSLNADGAVRFGEVTGNNIGRGLAILLDKRVQSAPTINGRISDSGVIEGRFTQQEVDDLVTVLKSGALPAEIKFLEERTVGPSLGQDSIDSGLNAAMIASILVVIAMLIIYKGSGINAVVALVLNFLIVFGALAWLGATLTVPGIAGIILTIGMAVDANVLVFERIREELHNGRTVKSAIQSGFSKAFSSIFDANLTTLIAALLLIQFGTGPVRGFAVTLSIGIFASVFTAVFVSRWIFDLVLSRKARVESLSI